MSPCPFCGKPAKHIGMTVPKNPRLEPTTIEHECTQTPGCLMYRWSEHIMRPIAEILTAAWGHDLEAIPVPPSTTRPPPPGHDGFCCGGTHLPRPQP